MKCEKKDKVVSMQRWMEIRSVEQTIRSGMLYQSFIDEMADVKNSEDQGYFRLVYCIPGDDSAEPSIVPDLNPRQLLMMVYLEEEEEAFPSLGAGVERYEIYDMATDDVHVMYRAPYRTTHLRAIKKSQTPSKLEGV